VTGWLLETYILSELRRPRTEPKVLAFIAARPLDHLYVSAVTFAEIRFGIELVADASRCAELTRLQRLRFRQGQTRGGDIPQNAGRSGEEVRDNGLRC
jgi:predicted nucleic acid-binding protein